MSEIFRASAQYDDWKGTIAADDHDHAPITKYLQDHQLIQDDERLVAISVWSGDLNHVHQETSISVSAFVIEAPTMDEAKSLVMSGNSVKEIQIKMQPSEFFYLFKRFEICFSRKGFLDNQQYSSHE